MRLNGLGERGEARRRRRSTGQPWWWQRPGCGKELRVGARPPAVTKPHKTLNHLSIQNQGCIYLHWLM